MLKAPFLPVVAKEVEESEGRGKYFIEDPQQWERLQGFLLGRRKVRHVPPDILKKLSLAHSALERVEEHTPDDHKTLADITADIRQLRAWRKEYEYPSNGQNQTAFLQFQEFIETPSDRFTSYRVLVTASGRILAANLYYSVLGATYPKVSAYHEDMVYDPFFYLRAHDSEVFLNDRPILSNSSSGGSSVVLNLAGAERHRASPAVAPLLESHGLHAEYPQLPDQLVDWASKLGPTLVRSQCVIGGCDFLQQNGTKQFYFLEDNISPGSRAYREANNIPASVSNSLVSEAMYRAALVSLVEDY